VMDSLAAKANRFSPRVKCLASSLSS
jgi:hypothetical protein